MSASEATTLGLSAPSLNAAEASDISRSQGPQRDAGSTPQHLPSLGYDWLGPQPDSASSTPTVVAAHSAAVRWLGVLTSDTSGESFPGPALAQHLDNGFLEDGNGDEDGRLTPLQRATRAVDGQSAATHGAQEGVLGTESVHINPWHSAENIPLLHNEQRLFDRFLRRISSWVTIAYVHAGHCALTHWSVRIVRPCPNVYWQSATPSHQKCRPPQRDPRTVLLPRLSGANCSSRPSYGPKYCCAILLSNTPLRSKSDAIPVLSN